MSNKEADFLKKLLATFRIEAEEHVKVISGGLIELEKASDKEQQNKILELIFREAHSFKGAARAVNLSTVEAICRNLESIFARWKQSQLLPEVGSFDLLHNALDFISKFLPTLEKLPGKTEESARNLEFAALQRNLENFASTLDEQKVESKIDSEQFLSKAELSFKITNETQPGKSIKHELTPLSETVRISTKKLDALLLKAEELFTEKLSIGDLVTEIQKLSEKLKEWKKERAKLSGGIRAIGKELKLKINSNGNEKYSKLLDYINWNDSYLKLIEDGLGNLIKSAKLDYHELSIMSGNLLEEMKNVLMFPFSSLLESFPKIVRDLSHDQRKEVELRMFGTDIEIDRRILEEMKDPFIHMIRNCIDHGIEKPEERIKKGKRSQGTITLNISQVESDKVEIKISDDGAGINLNKIIDSALAQKIVNEKDAAELNDQQALELIFRSGISSSAIITDISGRGLGLAIVREKVEKLRGTINVETREGAGTSFHVALPLTKATFRGIFISLDDQTFVVPTTNVKQVIRVKKEIIKSVENRATIQFNGKVIPLVNLGDVLGIERRKNIEEERHDNFQIIVISFGDDRIAFLVDAILGEQEILIKPLDKQLSHVKNIGGATILGSGKVVPVLNVFDLMKSAFQTPTPFVSPAIGLREEIKKKSVLVAEDSITARTLLKNILEVAGYDVTTAIDGIDAFTQLRTKHFDIVVSDVDMPRMSGFDLTTKIRSTKEYSELPVVLVTALESHEDRERGIDVGANAYIVKSSFDQKNLLEVIRQLM